MVIHDESDQFAVQPAKGLTVNPDRLQALKQSDAKTLALALLSLDHSGGREQIRRDAIGLLMGPVCAHRRGVLRAPRVPAGWQPS